MIALDTWMIKQFGGRDLNLADWIESGFGQARQMGVFVSSDKIMERLARAARRDFRKNFLTLVVSQLSIETTEQLERALAEPLEDA
jgi:hypothetical protein